MLRLAAVCLILMLGVTRSEGQSNVDFVQPIDQTANYQTEVLLSGLDNPTGVVLRPAQGKTGPYELFLAESGAGRVVRVMTDALEQTDEVIVSFPLGTLGQDPQYRVGPMGLAFITRNKLVVGCKQQEPGNDIVAGFVLPKDEAVLNASEPEHSVGPLDEKYAEQVDDLQFGALTLADNICFFTSGGRDSQGYVLKSGIKSSRLSYLQTFIDLQKTMNAGAPSAIAVIPHPRPGFLVVALTGSRETPQDSRLAFFVPSSGELVLELPTGLSDISSLAYSPSGQLYAADFNWHDEQAGGVYRIDDAQLNGQQTCRAVKIASVVRPFSMAFAPDGSLYVTAFGEGANSKQGSLIKITGEL